MADACQRQLTLAFPMPMRLLKVDGIEAVAGPCQITDVSTGSHWG